MARNQATTHASTPIPLESAKTTQASATVTDTASPIIAALTGENRYRYLFVYNNGTDTVYLRWDGSASTTTVGVPLPAGEGFEWVTGVPDSVSAIRDTGNSGAVITVKSTIHA